MLTYIFIHISASSTTEDILELADVTQTATSEKEENKGVIKAAARCRVIVLRG